MISVKPAQLDEIQEVVARVQADPRPEKIDLGIGIYRTPTGGAHLFEAVATAREQIASLRAPTPYLSQSGDKAFIATVSEFVFNDPLPGWAAVQTVGGTGAVRLAMEFAAEINPQVKVHVGTPTWANHLAIPEQLRIPVAKHAYFDVNEQKTDSKAIAHSLNNLAPGDVFVMHGSCHNPSGGDLSLDERLAIIDEVNRANSILLVDAAYFGLGDGIDQDLELLRSILNHADNAFLCLACSKAFGLYGERVGALFTKIKGQSTPDSMQAALNNLMRRLVSSAPRHGAEIVTTILSDPQLKSLWLKELNAANRALIQQRQGLAESIDFWPSNRLTEQKGIFALLPLPREQIQTLDKEFAIHMPYSGRINLTGIKPSEIDKFANALRSVWG